MISILKDEIKRNILFLVVSGIALIISLFNFVELPFNAAWVAIFLCGIPILIEASIGLFTRFDIKADVLVAMALIAAIIIGEIFAAGEVAFIMQIGALLEEITVAKARAGIEKLVNLTPTSARIIKDEKETMISAEKVKKGDLIRVLPGETIPVDGVIFKGETSVDQSVMTGEPIPVDKIKGDEVFSGTVNQIGSFDMEATKVGKDSSLQRMVKLVQSADADKAKIVGIADRFATWIVILAVTFAIITWIFTGEIIRAVTVLVVFCPCALVLATPTAIMAAIGNGAKYGFLVKEGDALEKLSKVKRITFDKTGTLTYGKPTVVAIKSFLDSISTEELNWIVASSELRSEHPLGKAIVASYNEDYKKIKEPKDFSLLIGKGVKATFDNKVIFVGNKDLMAESGTEISDFHIKEEEEYINDGCTIIWVSIDGVLVGFIALSDVIRENVVDMLKEVKKLGVTPLLLTGDHKKAAEHVAKQTEISDFVSECLPEDKLKSIKGYQKNKESICMVGDGINDAPALKISDVGIAMGGIGSDIAVEAADIALVNDDVLKLPHLIGLSKRMMTTIKLNMIFSMGINFIAIVLAMTGILNPVIGALVHNAGSVIVILNSATLLKWENKTNYKNSRVDDTKDLCRGNLFSS